MAAAMMIAVTMRTTTKKAVATAGTIVVKIKMTVPASDGRAKEDSADGLDEHSMG